MIALYLLASHLTGDFVLQTRWQAVSKLTNWRARLWHCVTYTWAFAPVIAARGGTWPGEGWLPGPRAVAFDACLFGLHFATDSRRFRSTLGDVVQWRLDYRRNPEVCAAAWLEQEVRSAFATASEPGWIERARKRVLEINTGWPPPNPWPAAPLMIDQTLHIIQIAVLAAVFLR